MYTSLLRKKERTPINIPLGVSQSKLIFLILPQYRAVCTKVFWMRRICSSLNKAKKSRLQVLSGMIMLA